MAAPQERLPIRRGPGLVMARVGFVILACVLLAATQADLARSDGPEKPIFQGVVYGSERLSSSTEGGGVVHWVSIDLRAPELEFYVTPLDSVAQQSGWEYRLRYIGDVLRTENLSVVINAALFVSQSSWRPRLPGDLARSVETLVSDHIVNHVWEHTYLLTFDDALNPRFSFSKPPTPDQLARARWALGGQGVGLRGGKVWPGADRRPDARTAIAIDRDRNLLYLAVAEKISPRLLLEKLASLGAKDGMLLDGGTSSALAFGQGVRNAKMGVVFGGWRPVATYFGIRARPLGN